MRRRRGRAWRLALRLLAAASAASLAGGIVPWLDPVAAFQVPLAAAWAVLLLALVLLPRARAAFWRPAPVLLLAAGGFLLHGGQAAWLYVPPPREAPVPAGTARVVWCNVLRRTRNREPLLRLLERADADLVGLAEANRSLAAAVHRRFPERDLHHDPAGELLLLSRRPLSAIRVLELEGGHRALEARTILGGAPVTVLLYQTGIPGSPEQFRNLELLAAAAARHSRLLLLADLDATPWSAAVRRLRRLGGLHDLRLGHGIRPTWRPWESSWGLLPLDHALARGPLRAREFRVLGDVGSDHLPLALVLEVGSTTPGE